MEDRMASFQRSLTHSLHTPESESQQKSLPPPSVLIDQEPEYEVEEIIDSRLAQGKLKYLVQWKGYDSHK